MPIFRLTQTRTFDIKAAYEDEARDLFEAARCDYNEDQYENALDERRDVIKVED